MSASHLVLEKTVKRFESLQAVRIEDKIHRLTQYERATIAQALPEDILSPLVDIIYHYYHVPDLVVLDALKWSLALYQNGDLEFRLTEACVYAAIFCGRPCGTPLVFSRWSSQRDAHCYGLTSNTGRCLMLINRDGALKVTVQHQDGLTRWYQLEFEILFNTFLCLTSGPSGEEKSKSPLPDDHCEICTVPFDVIQVWFRFILLVSFLHPEWAVCQAVLARITTDAHHAPREKVTRCLQKITGSSASTLVFVTLLNRRRALFEYTGPPLPDSYIPSLTASL
jgi:hypothetical protein